MATVTKPMALDESFNTTENTSRNVADVLAEGLDNIAESILPKAATEIPIQSGSATNTKDYIDTGLSGKQAKIKQETINTTTTSAGLVNLAKKTGDGEYVLSVTAVTNYGGYYCTLSLTTSGEWYANVKQVSDNSSVNNTSVAIKVVWCEI